MLTILVADDEFTVLDVLSVALEGAGYRVLRAGDGADALRILVNHACDLIVCDEKMPLMDGHQLIAAVRAEPRLCHIPVILMAEPLDRPPPEFDAGVVVIGKPVLLSELLGHIERLGTSRRTP